jgi:HD-GYP domain-containing protein (c-di-GMP phosphodiesterase class II)
LRSKFLFALLLAALSPLAVYAYLSFSATSRALERQERIEMANRSEAVQAALEARGKAVVDQVVSYGEWAPFCRAIDQRNLAWLRANVTVWVPTSTALKGAQVLTVGGEVVTSGGDFRGVSLRDAPVVEAARQGRNGFDVQAVKGRLYVLGAGPVVTGVVNDSRIHGVVAFGEPVGQAMLANLARVTGASGLSLYVHGLLVASSARGAAKRLPVPNAPGGLSVDGRGTAANRVLRNDSGEPQAVLHLTAPSAAVSVTDAALLKTTMWTLLIALLIAVSIGLATSRALTRPLRKLAAAARAIKAGTPSQQLEVRSRDEIGELSRAFNAMTAQIAADMREKSDAYARLDATYLATVTALATAMEAKDHYTAAHAESLAEMALVVGRGMGLRESELRDLHYAAVLHDIGKIGIPGHILNKPGRLSADEFAVMAEHTIIGERIISPIEHLRPVARIVRSAHERWDGHGYPDQLTAREIPVASRILLVCDAYHAMTSDRPYRGALPLAEAVEELRRNAGTQFDPAVVAVFIEVLVPTEVPTAEERLSLSPF